MCPVETLTENSEPLDPAGICCRGHRRVPENVNKTGGCRTCIQEHDRIWRLTPEGQRSLGDAQRRTKYRIDPAEFDALVLEAQGRCEICGRQGGDNVNTALVVDHDHATFLVRGLICGTCNRALSYVERGHVTIDWVASAQQYLKTKASTVTRLKP